MVHRIDVTTLGEDAAARSIREQFARLLPANAGVETVRIFLIDSDADSATLRAAAMKLLADPIVERATVVTAAPSDAGKSRIEIHLKPGVMDPVAGTTEAALRDAGLDVREVRTGRAVLIDGGVSESVRREIAAGISNNVIEHVHLAAFLPSEFEHGRSQAFARREVKLCDLTDAQLQKLSREGHLFLSLPEMQSVQAYFRSQNREPSDIELETMAQTWSEHCVHKTLKSAVDVCDESGKVLRSYKNLIKETIFDSTMELISARSTRFSKPAGTRAGDFCLSVFKDNAGVIAFDETDAVCFKVETHNHPSAIEPYGGAATGAGGCIRDVLGTGRAAKPIANTDIFCVANLRAEGKELGAESQAVVDGSSSLSPRPSALGAALPSGVIPPARVLRNVVAGVRDYGNRMGIPTVNGAVYFDDRYVANPLVFCGCAGLIPRNKIDKKTQPGDAIVVMGGRTGRDGIHGATFSSAELTDTHADEFSHAVQIGNAITQKKMADVLLAARDLDLFSAVTDCGAGGLSSAVGEMAETTGATVELDRVPLKYAGLRYDEIWISEAQERMVLSVPAGHVEKLLAMCAAEDVEATVIGTFGTEAHELVLRYAGTEVGRLAMAFMHDGLPKTSRKAMVSDDLSDRAFGSPRLGRGAGSAAATVLADNARSVACADRSMTNGPSQGTYPPAEPGAAEASSTRERLLALLASPNIASKHSIIRQYDHEVQGGSVIKPLIGPQQIGPSDAAVIRPKLSSRKGVVLACGMAPHIEDPYAMAIASIDEAIRNAVCVGASLDQLAILDNFCWPSVDDELTMGTLVRACEACRDAALAFGVPFISGKDSLHNQFTDQATGRVIRIPRTLLISAIGVVEDVGKCVTMDFKAESIVLLVLPGDPTSLQQLRKVHASVAEVIAAGDIRSCHDISDGGPLVTVAEMCIASNIGWAYSPAAAGFDAYFDEVLGGYVIEVSSEEVNRVGSQLADGGHRVVSFGVTTLKPAIQFLDEEVDREVSIAELTAAWRGTTIV